MNRVRDRFIAGAYRSATHAFEPAIRFLYTTWGMGDSRPLRNERLARNDMVPVDSWWHAASLGEIAALEPVLSRAQERNLTGGFVVTMTSRPGRDAARKFCPDASLAPLDLPRTIARALEARRPRALVLVETELWPNWLRLALDGGTRIAIVNGRISDRGWSRWRRGAPVSQDVMRRIGAIAARTNEDAMRFNAMGVPREAIRVTGNTKHDRPPQTSRAQLPWNGARLWTVGSMRPGEEGPVLDAFVSVRERFHDLRLVLAPRHADAEPQFLDALERRGLQAARRSRPELNDATLPVLLLDTRGELESVYAASTIAFVGGTLVPVGGHNVMEPARAGIPILVGPHHANVSAEVKELTEAGALRVVNDATQLTRALTDWLASEAPRAQAARAAATVAERSRGAAGRALDWLVTRGVLPAV
jgi:3-deoxy-D-manno-octulosonic-acid transferase